MGEVKNKQSTKHLTSFFIITFHTLVVNKIITKDIYLLEQRKGETLQEWI